MAGEALRPAERLVRGADYLRCYRKGRRRSGRFLMLYFVDGPGQTSGTESAGVRLGLTASRKVGGAVVRNRLRRRAREVFRRSSLRPLWRGWDLVVHFQPTARTTSFAELRSELEGLLSKPPGRFLGAARAESSR